MGKIRGVGVYNYHNILNMGQNQMNRNKLEPFRRSELAQISLLGPLGQEARPNYLRRGFCAMLFPLVVQLVLSCVMVLVSLLLIFVVVWVSGWVA
jgi:hypothetical protein